MPGGRGGYNPYATNSNSHAIRQEIQRFESVHPSIYAIYDLIDLVPDPHLAQQIREHVVCIEGRKYTKSGKSNHLRWNPGNKIIEIRENQIMEIQENQIVDIRGYHIMEIGAKFSPTISYGFTIFLICILVTIYINNIE